VFTACRKTNADAVANLDDLDDDLEHTENTSPSHREHTATSARDGAAGPESAAGSRTADSAADASGAARVLSEAELAAIDSRRARMRRHADSAMLDFRCDMALLQRHQTMMRILVSLVLATVYFSVSYYLDFGMQERNLIVSPYEVRWVSRRFLYFLHAQYLMPFNHRTFTPLCVALRSIYPVCVVLVCERSRSA
jgi:hypothetical protein